MLLPSRGCSNQPARQDPRPPIAMKLRHSTNPSGLAYARVIAFMLGFAALIIFVAHYYLYPAMEAAGQATPQQKKLLAAHAWLLMALILFIILVGLILIFRVGRFFIPRSTTRAKPTNYPDAWAESARRVKVDEEE